MFESDTFGHAGYPKEYLAPLYFCASISLFLSGSSFLKPHSIRINPWTYSARASANCTVSPWNNK